MAEEKNLELAVLNKAGREALVESGLRDAEVAACSNAMACWTACRSDDLWCGSRHKPAKPFDCRQRVRGVALLEVEVDVLQRGVGKCRVLADGNGSE